MAEKKKGATFYRSVAMGTMEMNAADAREMDKGWSRAVVVGITMMILGGLAIIYPVLTSVGVVYLLGAVLVVGAVAQLVHAFSVRNWKGFFWHLFLVVVYEIGRAHV